MRLSYNVLCIDDEIESLGDYKQALKKLNDSVGIHTEFSDISVKPTPREVDPAPYKDRIFAQIGSEFSEKNFDLIMVDLHLGPSDSPMGFKGHEIIQHIHRTQTMYRPIIFYSGGEPDNEDNAISQLQADIQEHGLLGRSIFISSRGRNLTSDLIGICKEMHKEEHRLNATRGLLMDGTSELDARVLHYLRQKISWDKLDADQNKKLHKLISDKLKKDSKNASKTSEALKKISESDFEEFKEWILGSETMTIIRTLDSQTRNEILRRLLGAHPDSIKNGDIHSRYYNDGPQTRAVSNIRNDYGHKTAEQIGANHNPERCKYIREELRAHFANIDDIISST